MTQQTPAAVPTPFRLSRMISSLWVPQAISSSGWSGAPGGRGETPSTTGAGGNDDLANAASHLGQPSDSNAGYQEPGITCQMISRKLWNRHACVFGPLHWEMFA
jgi:hypothetical protein